MKNNLSSLGFFAISFASVMFFLTTLSFGQTQTQGTISGNITDSSGGVIPGVEVTATNTGGLTRTSWTNDTGRYVFANLPFGTYDISAQKEGFAQCVNHNVVLDPAGTMEVNCSLRVGAVSEKVEVQAQTLAVQTEDSKVSRVITNT